MKDKKLVATLVGGLVGVGLIWLTYAPDTVTQAEMVAYVEAKVDAPAEHLRFLRADMRVIRDTLMDVKERVIRMELILTGRDGDG